MKLLYPEIFSNVSNVSSLFSLPNRDDVNQSGEISGLNLGYNTVAPKEEIDQNFDYLFNELGWERSSLAIANQVHGTVVRRVSAPGVFDATDGLITNQPGITLGIRVADCAAILAGDPVSHIVGAFHAGWKGAAGGIVPKGIQEMVTLGADPEEILIYISPCISVENFEVGEEVAEKFPDRFVDRTSFKKPHVDLKGFILWQLLNSGVRQDHIEVSTECTVANSEFYSYRRERDRAGRMLGMIKINE